MSVKLFRATFTAIVGIATVNLSQVHSPKAFEIRIPNPVGMALELMGLKTYKLTPAYENYIKPYIRNQEAYDKMMSDYAFGKKTSEKANVDLLIKLGLVRYKPEWLNDEAWTKLETYYPGIRNKKTGNNNSTLKFASLEIMPRGKSSSAEKIEIHSDQYAQAPVVAAVLTLTLMESLAAITVFGLDGTKFSKFFTAPALRLLILKREPICNSLGGCTQNATPVQGGLSSSGVDCARVIHECRDECVGIYAGETSGRLPGVGHDSIGRIRRCIRECAKSKGCEL